VKVLVSGFQFPVAGCWFQVGRNEGAARQGLEISPFSVMIVCNVIFRFVLLDVYSETAKTRIT